MTAWPPSLITATTHKTMKTMKTTLTHAHDLTHAERSAVIDRALFVATHLRYVPAPQVRAHDQSGLQSLRPAADLGKLCPSPQLRQPCDGATERAGQASGVAGKSRCTPACTGCMSGQMDFARGVVVA